LQAGTNECFCNTPSFGRGGLRLSLSQDGVGVLGRHKVAPTQNTRHANARHPLWKRGLWVLCVIVSKVFGVVSPFYKKG